MGVTLTWDRTAAPQGFGGDCHLCFMIRLLSCLRKAKPFDPSCLCHFQTPITGHVVCKISCGLFCLMSHVIVRCHCKQKPPTCFEH